MSLLLVVYLIYRIYPPEVKLTPHATQLARDELARMGPMSRDERIMLAVFVLIAGLWMTTAWHHVPYTVVALFGVSALLLTNVLSWEDALSDRQAWDTFIWYGGLVHMAEALGDTGVTRQFAEFSAAMTAGWGWGLALARPAARLFLRPLRLRQHHRPRHGDVHTIPGRDDRGRRAARARGARARLCVQSPGVPDPLRHDPGPDLFRFGLCDAAGVVDCRVRDFARHADNLGNAGSRVVEIAGLVVTKFSRWTPATAGTYTLSRRPIEQVMTYQLKIEQKPGYLHAIATGQNSTENVRAYLDELRGECIARGCSRVLIEERLEGPRLKTLDVFEVIFKGSKQALGLYTAIAYVDLNAESDLMNFAQTAAVIRGLPVSVFATVAEAEQWISRGQPE